LYKKKEMDKYMIDRSIENFEHDQDFASRVSQELRIIGLDRIQFSNNVIPLCIGKIDASYDSIIEALGLTQVTEIDAIEVIDEE
jgi:hypothetical protein